MDGKLPHRAQVLPSNNYCVHRPKDAPFRELFTRPTGQVEAGCDFRKGLRTAAKPSSHDCAPDPTAQSALTIHTDLQQASDCCAARGAALSLVSKFRALIGDTTESLGDSTGHSSVRSSSLANVC